MREPSVLVQSRARERRPLAPDPNASWRLLGTIGVAFTLIGGLDVALAWHPLAFGNAQWEFGTITVSLTGMPLLALGLLLFLGAATARGSRLWIRVSAAVLLVLAIAILAAAVLYATDIPLALRAVPNPLAKTALKKAMTKTACEALVYPALFIWTALRSWKASSASGP